MAMDAPKSRYRIEEKDGRLVVTDTGPLDPVSAPRRDAALPHAGPSIPPHAPKPHSLGGPSQGPRGLTALLLRAIVSRWDDQGRAVIAWEWEQNGAMRRWDAVLDARQQRRLARAMAAIFAFPLLLMLSIVGGTDAFAVPIGLAFVATAWGVMTVGRIRRETGAED
jgi:hypothetical protein